MKCCKSIVPLGAAEHELDRVEIEIMELAHAFRTTLETIPRRVPYIFAETDRPPTNTERPVGLVWQAGDWDDRRSVDFHELTRLFDLSGIEMLILENNARKAGWIEGYGCIAAGQSFAAMPIG